jgi:hypothetical protein
MNTANLQLEGIYVAISALMTAIRQKGLLTAEEIEASLASAEKALSSDPQRSDAMSPAHVDAILFPLRYLRLANGSAVGHEYPSFAEITARVGREKPQQGDIIALDREDIEASEDADVRRLDEEEGYADGRSE